MIDQELTVEVVCEIYDEKIVILKKEIDRLNEVRYFQKLENCSDDDE